jgi:hypothetical protein
MYVLSRKRVLTSRSVAIDARSDSRYSGFLAAGHNLFMIFLSVAGQKRGVKPQSRLQLLPFSSVPSQY